MDHRRRHRPPQPTPWWARAIAVIFLLGVLVAFLATVAWFVRLVL